MGRLRSQKQEREHLVRSLRASGKSWVEVAEGLRQYYRVNARVELRYAHGWSQRRAADEWNHRWPDELKTFKSFSYWELWPSSTGHAPSFDNLGKLAELYECAVSDLLVDLPDFRHLDVAGVAPFGKGALLLTPPGERGVGGDVSTDRTPVTLMRRSCDVHLQSYPMGQAALPTNKKLDYWTARLYVDVAEVRIPEETTDDLREPPETVDCLLDTVLEFVSGARDDLAHIVVLHILPHPFVRVEFR